MHPSRAPARTLLQRQEQQQQQQQQQQQRAGWPAGIIAVVAGLTLCTVWPLHCFPLQYVFLSFGTFTMVSFWVG